LQLATAKGRGRILTRNTPKHAVPPKERKGDEASQRNPKFGPRHAQTPLAIVIQIGTRDYVVDPYTCATGRHDRYRPTIVLMAAGRSSVHSMR